MQKTRAFARKAAQVNVPVLILGETGTGKSLLGKVIHYESRRARGPYLPINCAGIPDSLFESEFFGHQRGAFTGAREGRRGILEQAQGGSVFLDEVGELSVPQQAKLLTALEDGEIRRLGGEGAVRVDVRVLAATSRDLPREMREGKFRRELFHRLAVLTCHMPPLRNRKEDIPLLVRRLLGKHQKRHGRPPTCLPPDALRYLEEQPWPGNVRELSHRLEAALILSEGGALDTGVLHAAGALAEEDEEGLLVRFEEGGGGSQVSSPASERPGGRQAQGSRRYAFRGNEVEEREVIRAVLTRARGNKSLAARELGMARNTLRQKLRKYRLE